MYNATNVYSCIFIDLIMFIEICYNCVCYFVGEIHPTQVPFQMTNKNIYSKLQKYM